jgi:hypothetical protein
MKIGSGFLSGGGGTGSSGGSGSGGGGGGGGGRRGARSCSAAGSLQRARRTGQESPRSAARPPRAPRRRGARGPVAGAHGRPARRTLVGQRRVPLAPAPPAAAGSSGPWPLRLSLGAPGRTLPLPMGIREFPGGSPRGKSIAM